MVSSAWHAPSSLTGWKGAPAVIAAWTRLSPSCASSSCAIRAAFFRPLERMNSDWSFAMWLADLSENSSSQTPGCSPAAGSGKETTLAVRSPPRKVSESSHATWYEMGRVKHRGKMRRRDLVELGTVGRGWELECDFEGVHVVLLEHESVPQQEPAKAVKRVGYGMWGRQLAMRGTTTPRHVGASV